MNYKKILFIVSIVVGFFALIGLFSLAGFQWDRLQSGRSTGDIIELSDEEREILFGFGLSDNISEEESVAHYNFALKLSIKSDSLNVADCNLNPPVLQIDPKGDVTFINDGVRDVEISFDNNQYRVIAGSVVKAAISSASDKPSAFGYTCKRGDGLYDETSGLFVIPPLL